MLVRAFTFLLLLAAFAGTAGVPVASAQDPFGPIPQTPPEEPPAAPAPQEEDQGLNRTQELMIGGAGLVLLFGIGWAIVRDARTSAPVDRDHPLEEGERRKGSRTPAARRVQQGRAKAKAARKARRKNR
jgi:hypothetical protein